MCIVFFISGHGFGHASREVEIIHALAAGRPDARIIIRSAVSPTLLSATLAAPYELRPGPCDTGIVQTSSIEHDDPATVLAAAEFYRHYDARIHGETRALAGDDVALVVGDIAPIAFEVAARLGVPGVAIANFTWDWIYEAHPGMTAAAPRLVERIRASYANATLALELPFGGGFDVFSKVTRIPLIARRSTRTLEETRAFFGVPADRPATLLSFGGYGLPQLDLHSIDALDDWTIVTTDRVSTPSGGLPSAVRMITEDQFRSTGFRYEDLVGAVNAVVTKPGYGITAECVSTGTSMLYTSRGVFREYDVLTRELPRYVRSRFISQEDLLAGRWKRALHALMQQPPPAETIATNGAECAADQLLTFDF